MRSPFTGVLFALRKQQQQTEADLRQLWRQSEAQILDWLKPRAARLLGGERQPAGRRTRGI